MHFDMEALDVKKISEVTHHRVIASDSQHYLFATDNDIIYDVSFAEDNPIGDVDTFQFSVMSTNHDRPPFDPYVKQTILSILEEFFNRNASVILYVCDTSDSRQILRSRHFQRWFEGYEKKDEYVTLSGCIMDEGG